MTPQGKHAEITSRYRENIGDKKLSVNIFLIQILKERFCYKMLNKGFRISNQY